MTLQLAGRIATGDTLLDTDLRDLDIVATETGNLLIATTGQNGGISAWALSATGALARLADSAYFSVWGMGVGSFDAVDLDGRTQLILSGTGAGKLIRYRIEDDGDLSKVGKIDLPGPTTQTHDALTAATLTGGRSALYAIDSDTGAVNGWLSSGTGALQSSISFATPIAALSPDGTVMLNHTKAGGVQFLLAADNSTKGVRSYRIEDDTGQLTPKDSCGPADGLGLALPTALETVTAHGATWVVLAAAGSNSISVMQLAATGALTPTDHILDTRATRFDGVTALEVIEADGHVFVLAGGADDGLSLFYLLPGGQLVHMQTLAHEYGLGLENVSNITAVRIGDALQVFVSSGAEGGLSQFTLSLGGLGSVIEATGGADDVPLSGTEDGDLLLGSAGQTTLLGQAGNDILVSDASGGALTGGAGADIFVLTPTTERLVITDFKAGTDQLDLTRFPMLRSLEQLELSPTPDGIMIRFRTTLIEIHSHDGTRLEATDLWPNGFATPDRIAILPPSETLVLGTSGEDQIQGSLGAERIRGMEGDDTIRALAGQDIVAGGAGNDFLHGGSGHDILKGNMGQDILIGGRGNDKLKGGGGHDELYGRKGMDKLKGGAGADKLFGNGGPDRLKGGGGHDELAGQIGNDRLIGGAGRDQFIFAEKHGRDRIVDFTPGADHIRLDIDGLTHADLTFSASGTDTLIQTGHGTIVVVGLAPEGLTVDDFLFL